MNGGKTHAWMRIAKPRKLISEASMEHERELAVSTRREFLKRAGLLAGGSAVAVTIGGLALEEGTAHAAPLVAANDTIRMAQELQAALARPIETRRWGMVIDTRRCIGCHACTVACIAQNVLPVGVAYRKVPEVESGHFPAVQRFFMPTNCMQCENAPCLKAANRIVLGAMARRPDGIVTINYKRMKGRTVYRAAKKACPYTGALSYDSGRDWTSRTPAVQPYDTLRAREYGRLWSRAATKGTTRKCHFCSDRIDSGRLPACVATCTGQAMHFGDFSDPSSLVSERMRENEVMRIDHGAGTAPRVVYVNEPIKSITSKTCQSCHA